MVLFVLLAAVSLTSYAGVSIKNGNFWVAYVDIAVPGTGELLEIKRTYNSVSSYNGWFGIGWANKYESYLKTSADGSIVIAQGGAGTPIRYAPKEGVNVSKATEVILSKVKEKKPLSPQAEKVLLEKLQNDAEFRHTISVSYGVQSNTNTGSVFYATTAGGDSVTRTDNGWHRKLTSGMEEFYNDEGKLTKIIEASGYTVDIVYDKDGLVQTIKDNHAKQLYLSWYSNKKVKSIWTSGDKKVEYKYDGLLMSYAKNIVGQVYKYSYDKNFNMTQITYDDGTTQKMGYDPKSLRISSVTSRGGEETKYQFDRNPSNKNHFWTLVTKEGISGKPMTNRYEYELKQKPDGSLYTHRILTDIAGLKTETTYSVCCGLPLKIARGAKVTNFEYNDLGHLVKKSSSSGQFVNIDYDKTLNKISKVTNNKGWTKFGYDTKGNLTQAMNDQGQAVLLIYNREGRITKMIDQPPKKSREIASVPRNTVSFRYNAQGKPVEISMEGQGTIHVDYDNYGQVKKVDSKSGPALALKVTQTFQRLMTLVKPAGVNLGI